MKRISVIQLKRYVLVLLLSLASNFASAQSDRLYEALSSPIKDAIIRQYKNPLFVTYNYTGNTPYFSLVDMSSLTATSFYMDVHLLVHDMEIWQDWVYFCGEDSRGPLMGYFNIGALFSTGTSLEVLYLGGSYGSMMYPSYTEEVTRVNKLEVQPCQDGVHVYMVGHSIFSGHSMPTRCIVDMRYDVSVGAWQGKVTQEHAGVYYFDDVAVVDDSVVVIGHKNGSSGYYITRFQKPSSASLDLIIPSYSTYNYYYGGGWGDYKADPNRTLLIEAMYGNYYAVVGYANTYFNNVWDRGTVLSIYDGANCVDRCFISQGFADTASWSLRDLRYNKHKGILYLLQRMSNPVRPQLEYVLCEYHEYGLGSVVFAKPFFESDVDYYSMDRVYEFDDEMVVSVGLKGSYPRLWFHGIDGACINSESLPFVSFQHPEAIMDVSFYPYEIKPSLVTCMGQLENEKIILICR